MTNSADPMSVENGTAVIVRLLHFIEYRQTDLFVRFKQIKNPDIPLRDFSLPHVRSLLALFHKYGSDFSRGSLSVPLHHGVSTEDVTTLSNLGVTISRQVLNSGTEFLLLDDFYCREAMRQLQVERVVGRIQQRISARS